MANAFVSPYAARTSIASMMRSARSIWCPSRGDSRCAIAAWRNHGEHADARARGRNEWYEHFELRIAKVERAYGMRPAGTPA